MKGISVFISVLFSLTVAAQSYSVRYTMTENEELPTKLKASFSNKAEAQKYILQLPSQLLARGYLAASIDSVAYAENTADIWLYKGKLYSWGNVIISDQYSALANRTGMEKFAAGRVITGNQLEGWRQKILDYYAENGHPFAAVGLDSVRVSGDSLYGNMQINEGPLYKIDSIHLLGNVKLKPGFIYPYLHLKKGMPYQQSILDKIEQRLEELPFASPHQPWQLGMLGSGSMVNVYLEPKKSNIIHALLGIMPASTQTPDSKLLVTGEANILLRNAFSNGEMLGINWQLIQYKSPRLDMFYQQPYLFGSNAGIDFGFGLFKKDSQYVNLNFMLGLPYEFTGARQAKVFFQQLSTNVTYTDTNAVKSTRHLPYLSNVSSSNLGLEFGWNTTDYKLNPRKGMEILLSGIGGIKRIKKNNTVLGLKDPREPGFNFDNLYDTVKLKTYQLRITAKAAKYLHTGRLTVLKLAANAGWYQSGNYYRNELFQVGGYRLLRGFDEESIFARFYTLGTAEYRFITGKNAYFFAFADGGYAGYKDQQLQFGHTYLGAGLGMALETKNNVINLSWAIGKRNDLPLDLRQSKIHLGFVNYF